MSVGSKLKQIGRELKIHSPFTLIGAATGIIFMLIGKKFLSGHENTLFSIFHPLHVVLSAMVTAALFEIHRKAKNFFLIMIVGIVGSIGVATLSDCVIPFFGESILGVAIPKHADLHAHSHTDAELIKELQSDHDHSHDHEADAAVGAHTHEHGETDTHEAGTCTDPSHDHSHDHETDAAAGTHTHEHGEADTHEAGTCTDPSHDHSHDHDTHAAAGAHAHEHGEADTHDAGTCTDPSHAHSHDHETTAATDGHGHVHGEGCGHPLLHIGFIEEWYLVFPAAIFGVLLAYFFPHTKYPHAAHVLFSTWASSAHILMNTQADITAVLLTGIFIVLFLAVWLPCCVSDIIFPLLFVRSDGAHVGHSCCVLCGKKEPKPQENDA